MILKLPFFISFYLFSFFWKSNKFQLPASWCNQTSAFFFPFVTLFDLILVFEKRYRCDKTFPLHFYLTNLYLFKNF